ncbi:MAG: hypothetical protein ACLFWL_05910 [Candidatus Brocadiia bacterium]
MKLWMGFLGLFAVGIALAGAATKPLDQVVESYMKGDLETAIIPTPKRANLEDRCVEVQGETVCVVPKAIKKAADILDETGLGEKHRAFTNKVFESSRERKKAARHLYKGPWRQAAAKVNRPEWPDMLTYVLEIKRVFPDAQFVTAVPEDTKSPVVVLVVDGMNDAKIKTAGVNLPSLPEVEDKICAEERYSVLSRVQKGRPFIITRGATIWATLWGVATLRQMVFGHEGRRYVRLGEVQDWPTLWFRGGKRCKDWWVLYKGNGRFENWSFRFGMRHVPRSHSHWVSAKPKRLEKHKEQLRKAVRQKADWMLLDFNDGRFWTANKEDEPFPGDPARTVKYLFEELQKERDRLGSDIKLGYMPVGYAINRGSDREAKQLRAVNALEGVDFLMMNGLEVFSYYFPHEGAAAYRKAFGVDCKLLMYDCQSLRRRLRTPNFHDDQVYKHLHGISAQGASPVFFIGLADYTWNPEAYDPERALRLAARELADRDPEMYRRLFDYLQYYVQHSYIDKLMPREKTLELYKTYTDGMVSRLEKLKPLLEKGHAARATNLASYIAPPVRNRARAWPGMKKNGFKIYRVGRAEKITIDGKLDEPAWRKAATMDTFFPAPQVKGLDDRRLPAEGRAIVARALRGDSALYMAYTAEGVSEKMMEYVRGSVEGDLVEENPKKKPVFEIFIKPDLSRVVRWQLMHFVPKGHATHVLHYFDPENPFAGNHMSHNHEIKCSVTGENSYVAEIRIPFWEGIEPPKPGDVWGVQLQMNRVLAHRGTPYWLYHWTYAHDRRGLWAFEYPYGRWEFK